MPPQHRILERGGSLIKYATPCGFGLRYLRVALGLGGGARLLACRTALAVNARDFVLGALDLCGVGCRGIFTGGPRWPRAVV